MPFFALAYIKENAEVVASQRLVKMVDLVALGYHTGHKYQQTVLYDYCLRYKKST